MSGSVSWTSMGGHAQRQVRLVSYLSSIKGSTLTGRRAWLIIASATTRPKQEHTSVKTPFAWKRGFLTYTLTSTM